MTGLDVVSKIVKKLLLMLLVRMLCPFTAVFSVITRFTLWHQMPLLDSLVWRSCKSLPLPTSDNLMSICCYRDLSHNDITSLPDGIFRNLPNLKEL